MFKVIDYWCLRPITNNIKVISRTTDMLLVTDKLDQIRLYIEQPSPRLGIKFTT